MNIYSKKFIKLLSEQDDERMDLERQQKMDRKAMASELDDDTEPEAYDVKDIHKIDSPNKTAQQMYSELEEWIEEIDNIVDKLNGNNSDSLQSHLNRATPDTVFDKISNAETKKIARVAMELSSLNEILKGYLADSNNPKYKYV